MQLFVSRLWEFVAHFAKTQAAFYQLQNWKICMQGLDDHLAVAWYIETWADNGWYTANLLTSVFLHCKNRTGVNLEALNFS